MHFSNKETALKMPTRFIDHHNNLEPHKRYNRGTPDLYLHQIKTFYFVLTIRPRFVGQSPDPTPPLCL